MSLLIRSLRANGAFSVVSGLAAVIFAGAIAESLAVADAVLYVVGFGVLAFGASILLATRTGKVDEGFARSVIIADFIWVVAALVLLVIPESIESKWILAAVSAPVAVFAVAQTVGLSRSKTEAAVLSGQA